VVRRDLAQRRAPQSRFEASALGVGVFCRRERISAARLYRWQRERGSAVDRAAAADRERSAGIVDLGVLGMQVIYAAAARSEVDLGAGLVLRLVRH
jgi:hypothetical protein